MIMRSAIQPRRVSCGPTASHRGALAWGTDAAPSTAGWTVCVAETVGVTRGPRGFEHQRSGSDAADIRRAA